VKLACVVHRYGADIAGGSEGHCRLVAEHLAAAHDVTVLTTTARDHVTWANHYAAGRSRVDGVTVLRFHVDRRRNLQRFRELSARVFSGRASDAEVEQWFVENGPRSAALLRHLERHGRDYDIVLFWAYRYAGAYFGLPLVRDRAVLVPTAEDDPLVRVPALDRYFMLPRAVFFLTPEEETLVDDRLAGTAARAVIGCGVDPPASSDPRRLAALDLPRDYVLYLGRVDPNKGCATLFSHFIRYAESGRNATTLVLAGPANMPIPAHSAIRHLGYVDDGTRDALLDRARLLVMPSPYESLSMVLLEAWNRGISALVNGRCAVLKGQVLRADGGLYYRDHGEFAEALDYLLAHPDAARALGAQGRDYVDREYRWPIVMSKIETVLASVNAS
jgi:glycosyltransferase involved in cell wall biosynthesis